MSDVLARICADKASRSRERKRRRPLAEVETAARAAAPPRGFAARLATAAGSGYALIAEIKKASPSKGLIRADFDPPSLARAYQAGGATCLSVLTESKYFQGDDRYLAAARAATGLPALRKDFTLDPYQVVESQGAGRRCRAADPGRPRGRPGGRAGRRRRSSTTSMCWPRCTMPPSSSERSGFRFG
jgi:indole-3-glycerol phosphate synthase